MKLCLKKKQLLSIIIPVFNEEESISETIKRLKTLKKNFRNKINIELIFVNDGSDDKTFFYLRNFALLDQNLKIISFSRNFGHQIAITAGIDLAAGDYVAIIDGDLQDPPELIYDMYKKALDGFDVVYGKRIKRGGETIFKKVTAASFYKLLNYMCEFEIPADTGDFRLMSRQVVDAFKLMRERNRFVRGMIPWLGFKSSSIEYNREERFAGNTKYPLKKMLTFAMNAILSFSSKPLTIAIRVGFLTILLGLIGAGYILYLKLFTLNPVPGLTAILVSMVIFNGVQILLIGFIGEYISRIFEETKGRPLYLISETVNI
jgi:glycosyltransferase involved in cell wall biosynthesis